jgi:hypothetical protein
MQLVSSDLNAIPHGGLASAIRSGNVSITEGIGMGAGKVLGILGIVGLLTDPASAIGGPTTTMGDATISGAITRAQQTIAYPNGVDTASLQYAYDFLKTGMQVGAMDDLANLQFYTGQLANNSFQGGVVNGVPGSISGYVGSPANSGSASSLVPLLGKKP